MSNSISSEQARRQRAERRLSYGKKLYDLNLRKMRSKQSNARTSTSAPQPAGSSPASKQQRCYATNFAQNQKQLDDSDTVSWDDNYPEIFVESETLSEPPAELPPPSAPAPPPPPPTPPPTPPPPTSSPRTQSKPKKRLKLLRSTVPKATSPALHQQPKQSLYVAIVDGESRACERWQKLASTVPFLFGAKRSLHACDPLKLRPRLRQQLELLASFTRPFTVDSAANASSSFNNRPL